MKIKTKILLPGVISILMLLILGGFGYIALKRMERIIDLLETQGIVETDALNSCMDNLTKANVKAYQMFANLKNLSQERIDSTVKDITANIDNSCDLLTKLQTVASFTVEQQQDLAVIKATTLKYKKIVHQALELAGDDALSMGMMNATEKLFVNMDNRLDKIIDARKGEIAKLVANSKTTVTNNLLLNVFIFFVAIISVVLFSIIVAKSIINSLTQAINAAKELANGHLSYELQVSSEDEAGMLIASMMKMQEKLKEIIGEINLNVKNTVNSCNKLATEFNEISKAVGSQDDATAMVASAVEEMSVSIKTINDNADHALAANLESYELSTNGVGIIQQACDEMGNIVKKVNNTATVVENVGEQSKTISSIINVIREVAGQTNLLALNAAIEAARAGEYGRGFAVVADEVRKLAEKTSTSAEEITEMISTIQQSFSVAVTDIREVVADVQNTSEYALNAMHTMKDIHNKSEQTEKFAKEISHSLAEQSKASNLISEHVQVLKNMSGNYATSTTSASASMNSIRQQSEILYSAISYFIL